MSQQDTLAAAGEEALPPAPAALPALADPEPTWTRRDEKLLELLFFSRNWQIHAAMHLADKTPAQVYRRRERVLGEVRSVLEGPDVETPREWDDDEMPVKTAAGSAAAPGEAGCKAVVPVAAKDVSDVPTVAAGGGEDISEEGQGNKKKKKRRPRKKAEMWTRQEHKRFLLGIKTHGPGNWKTLAREFVTTKTAIQIASHYQKHVIRQEQRRRNGCKRASIHDITEAEEDDDDGELDGIESEDDAGEDDDSGDEPSEDGGPTHDEDEELSLFDELFPGEDDPGTLLT